MIRSLLLYFGYMHGLLSSQNINNSTLIFENICVLVTSKNMYECSHFDLKHWYVILLYVF